MPFARAFGSSRRSKAPDGSWPDADQAARTGTTSLVTLALLTAGEKADSPDDSARPRVPEAVQPRAAQQHVRRFAADHGLRRG